MITVLVPMFEWVQGGDHPKAFVSRDKRAMSYLAAGRTAEAIPLLERTLGDCERILGADHPDTKAVRANLAALTGEPARHGPSYFDLKKSVG